MTDSARGSIRLVTNSLVVDQMLVLPTNFSASSHTLLKLSDSILDSIAKAYVLLIP